jgi:phage/plasmid-associated DNA primase
MDDQAYFNRWMVVRFERTIEKKIPNFIKTLCTEEERSGLFNIAMKGLSRLLEQGAFSYSKSAVDTKLEMLRSGSSIAQFVSERIVQETGVEISKEAMYKAYSNFCTEGELQTETMDAFGKKFALYVSYVNDGFISDHDDLDQKGRPKRSRGWRNAAIIKTPEEANEEAVTDEELASLAEVANKL